MSADVTVGESDATVLHPSRPQRESVTFKPAGGDQAVSRLYFHVCLHRWRRGMLLCDLQPVGACAQERVRVLLCLIDVRPWGVFTLNMDEVFVIGKHMACLQRENEHVKGVIHLYFLYMCAAIVFTRT